MKTAILKLTALATACVLVGCAAMPQGSDLLRKDVRSLAKADLERHAVLVAQERWDLLIQKKFPEAFEYFTESSRLGIGPDFLANYITQLNATKAVAKKAHCEQSRCEVEFDLTISMRVPRIQPVPIEIPLKEVWTLDSGKLRMIRASAR